MPLACDYLMTSTCVPCCEEPVLLKPCFLDPPCANFVFEPALCSWSQRLFCNPFSLGRGSSLAAAGLQLIPWRIHFGVQSFAAVGGR